MNSPLLILASASPRRADLLRELGFEFHVVPSAAAEIHSEDLSAGEVAQLNAYRKARAVSKKFPDAVTLGVDTVVALGSTLFGKPADLAEAERMVLALLGKTHQVVTGVCLIHLRGHRQRSFCEQTDVTFRTLTLPANPALPRPGQSARQSGRLWHPGTQRGAGGIHFRFLQQRGGPAPGTIAGRTGRLRDSAIGGPCSPGLGEMQKYWHVIKIGFANTLVYRFNFFFRAAFSLIPLLATIYLWRTIYRGQTGDGGGLQPGGDDLLLSAGHNC